MNPKKSVKPNNSHLKNLSLFELTQALAYCEGLVSAVQNKIGHSLNVAKEAKLRDDLFEYEISKMEEIHKEHNEMSFAIEKEIDRRMKPMLKTRYGAVSVYDMGKKMDTLFHAEYQKKKEKSPLQLE